MILIKTIIIVLSHYSLLASIQLQIFLYAKNTLGGPRKLCTDMIPAWAAIFGDHLQLMS